MAHKLTEALKKGGFPLTQWATANEEVRIALPSSNSDLTTRNLDPHSSTIERTLGLLWNVKDDVFMLKAVAQPDASIFRRTVKRWVCLFTCLSSPAVNLQMAYSLDTDSFLIALNKFEMTRGKPSSYQSDNGIISSERSGSWPSALKISTNQ